MIICGGLLLAPPTLANPPPGDTAQLERHNRANEAILGGIQSPPGPMGAARQDAQQRQLNRKQQTEQRQLQERQRRDLLRLNQRARTSVRPGVPYSQQGIHLQRQFQLQQQNQLNRFRIQQGSPLRAPALRGSPLRGTPLRRTPLR